MDLTVEQFCGLLVRSKLRSGDAVKAVHQRWQTEAKDSSRNLQQFVRWLVAKQVVTDYQAQLLLKKSVDGFFLNQYQIVDKLGRGRMAGVYKAVHNTSGQVVAVKVLPPSFAKDPQMLGRFQREAKLALRLKHPNVVRSFQTGLANGLNYLVMEHLEGETLDETLLRRKRLPPQEAVRLLHQALMGLEHIHELGMVHRDLKPANLMVVPAPAKSEPDNTLRATVKILDIGLGRELFDESQAEKDRKSGLTSEQTILGTPDYLSPEQARDARTVDIRSDIYSLGCVLYHLLTGQPPFPDKNLVNQMVRHSKEMARPLKEFNPIIPDGLQQVVNWMMAKQPTERYPNPERAAQALNMFMIAEAEPRRDDQQPTMKKFLTWLDTAAPEAEPPTVPVGNARPPVAAPMAAPVARAASAAVAAPVAAPPAATPAPVSQSQVPTLAELGLQAEAIDVELVTLDAPRKGWLTHRDWVLLSLGAGVVGVLIIVVLVLVIVLRR